MVDRVLVIAEAGVNHNGDLELAKKLVDVAAESGADYVKFQTFNADRQVTTSAVKAEYQTRATDTNETQYEMLARLELTTEMHHEIIAHCALRDVGFLSTGFDIESIDFLANLGQQFFKIPSGEITNMPYLRHVGQFGKPVILSTGMSTLGDIEMAIEILENEGLSRDDITVLHCTTDYPVPVVDVNLRAMQTIRSAFGTKVGYSDHTSGVEVAIAATALGATVIEKHFTLDRNLPGPDHKASLEPNELKNMVVSIRNVEQALGNGIKCRTSGEEKNIEIARKSLVASCQIRAGDVFTKDNITAKRPGTGISPMRWDEIIGQRACKDFAVDEIIVI